MYLNQTQENKKVFPQTFSVYLVILSHDLYCLLGK